MKDNEIFDILLSRKLDVFPRGSCVYGTYEEGISDLDYLVVVDNACDTILCDFQNGEFQFHDSSLPYPYSIMDYMFVTEANFITSIRNNEIDRLECIFDRNSDYYNSMFILDKWKLRKSVSSICSNSWVKAKKKLIVDKDYNLRIAQKSLWHSMRLYIFGTQIAKEGRIFDFSAANYLWYEIKSCDDPTWETYEKRYKKTFNGLRSEFVSLCEKPVETFALN